MALMKKLITFGVVAAGLGLTVSTVSGYGPMDMLAEQKLGDRPFAMSCVGQNVVNDRGGVLKDYANQTTNHPMHASGIPMPSPEILRQRVGADRYDQSGYFGLEFLTPAEGELPDINKTVSPVTGTNHPAFPIEHSNQAYFRNGRDPMHTKEAYADAIGNVSVSHYYVDGDNELQPIRFHVSGLMMTISKIGPVERPSREVFVGSYIPSDAKYAVYEMKWEIHGASDAESGQQVTGWYALPLTSERRFQPVEYSDDFENMSLGPYQFWEYPHSGSSERYQFPYPKGSAARHNTSVPESPGEFKTVPCFANAQKFVNLIQFFYDYGGNSDQAAVKISPSDVHYRGMAYLGQQRDALEALPSNPYKFEAMEGNRVLINL